jgi:sorting nexin-8
MSLFGTSPEEPAAPVATSKSRLSLFDDEPSPAPGSKSSLFADDDNGPGWGLPTPKKAPRGEVIKNLLPASDVPDSYIDLFDSVVNAGDGEGGKISPSGVSRVLSAGKLGADEQARIVNVIAPSGEVGSLGRNEFNVLLALIGLAQETEDITLDGVDERRRSEFSGNPFGCNFTNHLCYRSSDSETSQSDDILDLTWHCRFGFETSPKAENSFEYSTFSGKSSSITEIII